MHNNTQHATRTGTEPTEIFTVVFPTDDNPLTMPLIDPAGHHTVQGNFLNARTKRNAVIDPAVAQANSDWLQDLCVGFPIFMINDSLYYDEFSWTSVLVLK